MPKKKLQEVAPEPEEVEAATETQEVAPAPEVSPETPSEAVDNEGTVTELPDDAPCYYVFDKDGVYADRFTVEEHKSDAKKKALAMAEQIGGTVQI